MRVPFRWPFMAIADWSRSRSYRLQALMTISTVMHRIVVTPPCDPVPWMLTAAGRRGCTPGGGPA